MRRINALLLMALVLSLSAGMASATPWIVWELKNAFPLIADEDYQGLRSIIGHNPSMHNLYLELAELDRQTSNNGNPRPYLLANPETTMYDRSAGKYKNGLVLVEGDKVKIQVRIEGLLGGLCTWRVDDLQVSEPLPCDTVRTLDAPVKKSFKLIAQPKDGPAIIESAFIKDFVVAAIGDSYASGEGNPDIPARYTFSRKDKDVEAERAAAHPGWAEKESAWKVKPAEWWDQECHRSLTSWPVMSVLRLALQDRSQHTRFTILSYACSGAEIVDGLVLAQLSPPGIAASSYQHRDGTFSSSGTYQPFRPMVAQSQVNALRNELCRSPSTRSTSHKVGIPKLRFVETTHCDVPRRKPDALLISIGGNDVAFGGIVKGVITPRYGKNQSEARQWWLNRMRSIMGAVSMDEAREKTLSLKEYYAKSLTAIAELAWIEPSKSIIVRYPNVVGTNENGCSDLKVETIDGRRIRDSNLIFGHVLNKASLGFIPIGWTVGIPADEVESFQKAFMAINLMQGTAASSFRMVDFLKPAGSNFEGRLLCDMQVNPPGVSTLLDDVPTGRGNDKDEPPIPRYFCQNPSSETQECQNLVPSQWRMHEPGRRVINALNDSVMAMRQWKNGTPRNAQLIESTWGLMHPIAEAHAEAADNVADELEKFLN
jgi:hypothetical protein